ncbi:uncharacterized protein A4U43_C08F16130 [Asparagus officinalis]|nr:uncharacterized protein A4U43_C08F16130 [Asparagus officinalis]
MATISTDLVLTFFSLAKHHRGLRFLPSPSLSFRSTKRASPLHARSLAVGSLSPPIAGATWRSKRRSPRASAAAPTTDEGSDVTTKIPPDNRILRLYYWISRFRQATIPLFLLIYKSLPLKPLPLKPLPLWASETTLLNHILTADHGKRIAVIENEFGEVDIDGSLVASKTAVAEDIVMLNNGCLCCTVRGDLVRMIAELVDKKKGKFDHIVIETTGLANPAPIIETFYAEDKIFNDVKLDGVVTLVDAKHARFHLDEEKPKGVVNEAVEQIAYADRIIVNKVDLVGDSDISTLVQRIKNINSMAHLKKTEYGKVDLDYVLGIGGFDLERIKEFEAYRIMISSFSFVCHIQAYLEL